MSMSGDDAYVLAMDYVDETLKGGGALKGDDGKSAYQSWLDLGNTGTEEDFINSLKGEKGQVGEKGETGNNGKSSYEIWLDNGNVGTEQDFLDSLKGEGADGFSPVITENSNNTDEDYRLDIETKESKFTTPNLKADIRKNIAEHNTSPDSHNDIRIFLNELNNRLNALANSDDETLDEMKEVVAYIKDNRSLIESITTTKVNVADIIDNLTTNVSNKPLSASQGVVIKNLIDTLQSELTAHVNNFNIHVTANDKTNWNNATFGTSLNTSVLEYALTLGTGIFKVHLGGSAYTGTDLPSEFCKYGTAIIVKRNTSSITVFLTCNGSGGAGKQVYFNSGNGTVWYGWQTVYTDINPPKIAEIDGLQTIADNSQMTAFYTGAKGWYRIAKYEGDSSLVGAQGSATNGCEITIKRNYASICGEEHRLLLDSIYQNQKFTSISSFTVQGGHLIKNIRYAYNSTNAYIDVYYDADVPNTTTVLINNARDNVYSWKTIESTIVAETVEGEIVSTVFDIPANANPVTNLDLTIGAIQGLRAELDELRSLITNS